MNMFLKRAFLAPAYICYSASFCFVLMSLKQSLILLRSKISLTFIVDDFFGPPINKPPSPPLPPLLYLLGEFPNIPGRPTDFYLAKAGVEVKVPILSIATILDLGSG